MEEIKAKRLNDTARRDIKARLDKSEVIKLLYNNNNSSWLSVSSIARSNTDSMLLVATALELAKANGTSDDLILEFSKARDRYTTSK